MNRVILMGRLTRDPETRYGGANNTAIAKFSLAVDRRYKREGQPTADFFNCTAFGKLGEFVEKYLHKGTKIVLEGEIQNNNYTNKDGQQVYGVQIVASNIEFAESKAASQQSGGQGGQPQARQQGIVNDPIIAQGGFTAAPPTDNGFLDIPDGIDDDDIPFA